MMRNLILCALPWMLCLMSACENATVTAAPLAPPIATVTARPATAASVAPTGLPGGTATAVPPELVSLQVAAQELCAGLMIKPQITPADRGYDLSCAFAAGHSTSVRIQPFDRPGDAQAAFRAAAAGHDITELHGYPLAKWIQPDAALQQMGAKYRRAVWQFGRWLISVSAFDDTHFEVAVGPDRFMETIYRAAVQQRVNPP
ncbi:MAG: hypothetical protein HZB53_06440 [Chloroflexi bacterium]|nr:hypothetical protein [Chloroflexota bacterium]